MTWIHDDPKTFVADALAGFAAANRRYVIPVDGGFVRAAAMAPGQVAVVIGGGSGHYPAFAGLVGPGLAAGAVCGNIFTSPSAAYAYRVAKAAQAGGGVLFSYGNYAGDVLHFGQAQERLNAEGIETRTVLVTDDIASAPPTEGDKRRGIAGDLVVFKIAGAAAENGCDLSEVERLARKANARTRTLGVAFAGCTLPGADRPLFTVPAGMMSLGLGIHGEPGISDHPLPRASELATLLVDRLLEEAPSDADGRVVAIVNGLGSVKYEELFLLFGKVEARLRAAGFEIIEPECGELVTSLDMAGVSLTLFWPDAELEPLWSAPADTPAYRKGSVVARERRRVDVAAITSATHEPASEEAVQLGRVAAAALEAVRRVLVENEPILGQLDAVAGDGDHGIGMRQGAEAAVAAAQRALADGAGVHELLLAAGDAWAEHAGGTSGALWGAAITAVARAIGNKPTYGAADAVAAAAAARDIVLALGGAELGDKTIVDALVPAVEAFERAAASGEPLAGCLARAAERARAAAAATAPLRPRKGRARPLAERSVGHPDPGATSFAIVVDALARFASGQEVAA
jgi:dihydroxyacetone kinase